MTAFSKFKLPDDLELWQLGKKKNWGRLEEILAPLTSKDNASVQSWEDEIQLANIRRSFDESKCLNEDWDSGIIFEILFGGDNAELLKKVLSLGINPDVKDGKYAWRPLHVCGEEGRLNCAKALLLCRPNLRGRNQNENTAFEAADPETIYKGDSEDDGMQSRAEVKKLKHAIQNALLQAERSGFPLLAEIAMEKHWWAVKNLIRRGIVTESEAAKKCNGRNALEWAVHHDERAMVEELKYYFNWAWSMEAQKIDDDEAETSTAALRRENELLKKKISELTEEKNRIQAQSGLELKKQVEEIQEAASMAISKVQSFEEHVEKVGTVEKALEDYKKVVENESSKLWKTIKRDQARLKNAEEQLEDIRESHSSGNARKDEIVSEVDIQESGSSEGQLPKKRKIPGPGSSILTKSFRAENPTTSDFYERTVVWNSSQELPEGEPSNNSAVSLPMKGLDPAKMYEDMLKLSLNPREAWNAVMKMLTSTSKICGDLL